MRTSANLPELGRIESTSTPPFEVVLTYQDFHCGIRAKEFFDRLVRDHGSFFRFLCHLWRFDFLSAPELSSQAIAEAVNADMIVIAARAQAELPALAKAWIERWRREPRTPGALVALLDGVGLSSSSVSAVCTYLRDVAATSQMRFFCNASPPSEMDIPFPVEINQRPDTIARQQGQVRFRDLAASSHWGINE